MNNTAWDIQENDYPDTSSLSEKIRFWLGYAILAPSAHNTQPWQFAVHDQGMLLRRNEEYTLKRGDPTLRETMLSLGAFIENFCIAVKHWHYESKVEILVKTVHDLDIADIRVSPTQSTNVEPDYFSGITRRHTNRGSFDPSPLSESHMAVMQIETEPDVQLFFITDQAARMRIARLVGRGTVIALGMPTMQRELAELVSRVGDDLATGMVVEALTESPPPDQTGHDWVMQSLDPQEQAKTWEETFATSPVHVIVGTRYDGPEAWLAAGRVMERVLVASAQNGLAHCIAAAPVEIPTLTPDLRREIDPDFRPQALFRLGVPLNKAYSIETGRRPISH